MLRAGDEAGVTIGCQRCGIAVNGSLPHCSGRCHQRVAKPAHHAWMSLAAPHEALQIDHFLPARHSLRLAVVTETWPPEINGVATTVARLVTGLQERHHAVQLVRPRQPVDAGTAASRPRQEVLLPGLPIPRYPHLRMGLPARRPLQQLWQRERPDAVHIATEGPLGFSALQAALHLRVPVTSDFRTNFHAYSQHYGVGWLRKPVLAYLRKFHNRCALTLVPTVALGRELQDSGFQRVQVLGRGVDTRLFSPVRRSAALRAQWGAAPDDLVVCCIGRLAPEKNLGLVLDTYEAIVRHHPRARLLLVGDGPMRAELQRRCPGALLAGQRRDEDLAAHYASADLFLFASQTETFGNVTAEAMASGLPVVAFAHAGAAQLITPGVQGELLACDDPAGFMATGLSLAADAPRRVRLGLAARARALQQDWHDIVGQFEQLVREAIGAPVRAATADLTPGAASVPA